jgi:polyadenylate-binding protein
MASNTKDEASIKNDNTQQQGQTNVYVKNFDNTIDESLLCELFMKYGTITSCKVSEYTH